MGDGCLETQAYNPGLTYIYEKVVKYSSVWLAAESAFHVQDRGSGDCCLIHLDFP
jgi:hypothetical protein